jgi:2'-5' RNA ligase
MERSKRHRLFLALWPTLEFRQQLTAGVQGWLGEQAAHAQRPEQWHTTLVFIGYVDPVVVETVEELAESVASEPFVLSFDHLDHWRKAGIACLTASATPAPLQQLVAELEAALDAAGVSYDRRPYRPHLTLARKVARLACKGPISPLEWAVDDFALVESISSPAGSRYEPLACYPCRG